MLSDLDISMTEYRKSWVHRHLHVSLSALEARLEGIDARELRENAQQIAEDAAELGIVLPLVELRRRFFFDETGLDLLLCAVRPQIRAEMRGRTVTLGRVLESLFDDPLQQMAALAWIRPDSALVRHRFVELATENQNSVEHTLERELIAPPWVAAFLLDQPDVGRTLSQLASFVSPTEIQADIDRMPVTREADRQLTSMVASWLEQGAAGRKQRFLAISIIGEPGSGKTAVIRRLALTFGRLLLEVDAGFLASLQARLGVWAIRELYAIADLFGAWLVIDNISVLEPPSPILRTLAQCVEESQLLTVLTSTEPIAEKTGLLARTVRQVALDNPTESERAQLWLAHLDRSGFGHLRREVVDQLAAQFEISAAQVRNACTDAALEAAVVRQSQAAWEDSDFERAAFRQLRSDPKTVARSRRVQLTFSDLVLPHEELELLREIYQACRHRTELMHRWGARDRIAYGTGVVCLFSGEPGTGKTLAAQILAAELGTDLLQVSLPQVLSKWVGDTEKQIARVFHEAKAARAVLLFDEADSLLSARTDVRSSSDRYANMSTNFLLQEIESFEGVVILTTNLEENLDSAAARRILFRIRFPFPDARSRSDLWRLLMPSRAKMADNIDFGQLGQEFELSGGHIKNSVIRAAYQALWHDRPVDMVLLRRAARKECRAIGKLVIEDDDDDEIVKMTPVVRRGGVPDGTRLTRNLT